MDNGSSSRYGRLIVRDVDASDGNARVVRGLICRNFGELFPMLQLCPFCGWQKNHTRPRLC